MARAGYVSLIALVAVANVATAQVRRTIGAGSPQPTVAPSGITVNTAMAKRPPGPAPASVSAVANGPTSITVSWSATEGATGYWVSRGPSATGEFRVLNQTPVTGTSFTDASLSPKTTAYYVVSGIFPDKFGQNSSASSATTPIPPQPTGFAATLAGPGAVRLSWNAPPNATSYWLSRSGSQVFNDRNFTATSYTDQLSEPGTYTYTLIAGYTYGGQQAGADLPTAPTATITVPRWRGHYRLIATGFSVRSQTWDHALQVDGKGDEVYLAGTAQLFDKNGKALTTPIDIAPTATHGDVNGYPERIRAGSLSNQGGIQNGDKFPSATPWLVSGTPGVETFPKELWQGDLVADSTFIVFTVGLFEWDGGKDAFHDWARASKTILGKVNDNKVVSSALAGTKAGIVLELAGLAADLAVSLDESGVLGEAGDRPIGVKDNGKGGYTYSLPVYSLNFADAEMMLGQSFSGLPPGVKAIGLTDDAKFHGDYTLYLRLERIP